MLLKIFITCFVLTNLVFGYADEDNYCNNNELKIEINKLEKTINTLNLKLTQNNNDNSLTNEFNTIVLKLEKEMNDLKSKSTCSEDQKLKYLNELRADLTKDITFIYSQDYLKIEKMIYSFGVLLLILAIVFGFYSNGKMKDIEKESKNELEKMKKENETNLEKFKSLIKESLSDSFKIQIGEYKTEIRKTAESVNQELKENFEETLKSLDVNIFEDIIKKNNNQIDQKITDLKSYMRINCCKNSSNAEDSSNTEIKSSMEEAILNANLSDGEVKKDGD